MEPNAHALCCQNGAWGRCENKLRHVNYVGGDTRTILSSTLQLRLDPSGSHSVKGVPSVRCTFGFVEIPKRLIHSNKFHFVFWFRFRVRDVSIQHQLQLSTVIVKMTYSSAVPMPSRSLPVFDEKLTRQAVKRDAHCGNVGRHQGDWRWYFWNTTRHLDHCMHRG
jgi:hypothetical protein